MPLLIDPHGRLRLAHPQKAFPVLSASSNPNILLGLHPQVFPNLSSPPWSNRVAFLYYIFYFHRSFLEMQVNDTKGKNYK